MAIGLALVVASCGMKEPVRTYTVRTDHPRIWLTPAILTRLRASAAANSPRWLALKQVNDTYLNYTDGSNASVPNYALAYQITRNSTAIARDSGYDTRSLLPDLALGYDWCYDRLSPDQRAQLQSRMEAWADWVWPQ